MSPDPFRILVVANETVGGRALLDEVVRLADKARSEGREPVAQVVCPQNQPKKGLVVYDETVREAAENRLRTTLAQLEEVGIKASGEVMDPDPYAATTDAFLKQMIDDYRDLRTENESRVGQRRDMASVLFALAALAAVVFGLARAAVAIFA